MRNYRLGYAPLLGGYGVEATRPAVAPMTNMPHTIALQDEKYQIYTIEYR